MDVQEYLDGACRCIAWQVGDEDLQAALASVDAFLTHAIGAISAEDPQPWLELNLWLDSGRLMVYGSNTGPTGDRSERLYFELGLAAVEKEFGRTSRVLATHAQEAAWERLSQSVWEAVRLSLSTGAASEALRNARGVGLLHIACFDYEYGEGIHRLPELAGV